MEEAGESGLCFVTVRGEPIEAVVIDGRKWVKLKRLCELVGVQCEGQRQRIKRNGSFTMCVTRVAVGPSAKKYRCWVMAVDDVERWMRTIDVHRVRNDQAFRKLAGTAGRRQLFIYFVYEEHGKRFKIGITDDVDKRVSAIRTQVGHDNELAGYFAGDHDAEQRVHAKFAHLRTIGEWFRDDPEIRKFIAWRCRNQSPTTPS